MKVRSKTEYMCINGKEAGVTLTMQRVEVVKGETFKNLGSIKSNTGSDKIRIRLDQRDSSGRAVWRQSQKGRAEMV